MQSGPQCERVTGDKRGKKEDICGNQMKIKWGALGQRTGLLLKWCLGGTWTNVNGQEMMVFQQIKSIYPYSVFIVEEP